MADIVSKDVRSYMMSCVKGRNTKIELIVRKFLHSQGFRFRIHVKKLPGTPDIVLPKLKTVIFINGCFWHGHKDCKYFSLPKANRELWRVKINTNIINDRKFKNELSESGWFIDVIWGCELKGNALEYTLQNLLANLKNRKNAIETKSYRSNLA